jgi:hypothetical protein
MMAQDEFARVTPGEILKEEFLGEYRLSQNHLPKPSVSLRTGSPKSSAIGGGSPPTLRFG